MFTHTHATVNTLTADTIIEYRNHFGDELHTTLRERLDYLHETDQHDAINHTLHTLAERGDIAAPATDQEADALNFNADEHAGLLTTEDVRELLDATFVAFLDPRFYN